MAERDLWLAIEELRSQQREAAAEIKQLRQEVSRLCARQDGAPRSRARSIVQSAEFTFDTQEEAAAWLQEKNPELDGLTPLDAARQSAEILLRAQGLLVEIMRRSYEKEPLEEKLKDLL